MVWILQCYGQESVFVIPSSRLSVLSSLPPSVVITPAKQSFQMVFDQNDRMAGSVPVWNSSPRFAENLAGQVNSPDKPADKDRSQEASFGLSDVIDIINPLQHIPVISHLYQRMTGDTIGSVAEIVGGALFGGPIGLVTSAGMVAYEAATGQVNDQRAGEAGKPPATAHIAAARTSYNV